MVSEYAVDGRDAADRLPAVELVPDFAVAIGGLLE